RVEFGRLGYGVGRLGNVTGQRRATRAVVYDAHGMPPVTSSVDRWFWLDDVARDIRYSVRAWRRRPAFALVAILTLAVGIGAVTVVFSIVEAVLLRPLPYADPDRLVAVWDGHVRDQNLAKIFAS